jgi:hypothetical protein
MFSRRREERKIFRFRISKVCCVGFAALKILALARIKSRVAGCLLTEKSQNIQLPPAKVEIFRSNTQAENSPSSKWHQHLVPSVRTLEP